MGKVRSVAIMFFFRNHWRLPLCFFQHPLVVVKQASGASAATESVVVVGHCCESGDLLSCAPGDPEAIGERTLLRAEPGDLLVVEGSGAYCSAMSTKHYNSFPEAPEVMLDTAGNLHVIRARQPLEQIFQNEVALPAALLA
jgi:diaminopimelate decarboxylase